MAHASPSSRRERAPTRGAPYGNLCVTGVTAKVADFDNPWRLRGCPSSQSSPVGRRGKTSRPHPCLPAGGCAKVSSGRGGRTRAAPASPRPLSISGDLCVTGATDREGADFDNPWRLRGCPSSQSSPVGRRGKTSRPHPCLPAGGCARSPAGEGVGPRAAPASPRPLSISPSGREAGGSGRPQGTPLRRPLRNRGDWPRRWRTSITRGGCEGAPHLNLLPRGEEARPPGPTHACPRAVVQRSPAGEGVRPRAATASPRPLSVSPSGREAGGVDARKGRPYGDLCVIRGLATRGGLGWGNGRFANRPYGRDGFPRTRE